MSSSYFKITPLEGCDRAAEWKREMGRVLSYEQYTYVTETKPQDGIFTVTEENKKLNHEAKFAIITSVSSSIQPLIDAIESSAEIWNMLENTYVKKSTMTNHHRIFQMMDTQYPKDASHAIAKILEEGKLLSTPVNNSDFLMALTLLSIRGSINNSLLNELLQKPDLTMEIINTKLNIQSNSKTKIGTKNSPIEVNAATKIQTCEICKKPGHVSDRCNRFCRHCKNTEHFTSKCNKQSFSSYPKNPEKGFINTTALIDSGASHNVFISQNKIKKNEGKNSLCLPDGSHLSVKYVGTIHFGSVKLKDVFFCDSFKTNIISVYQLTKQGYSVNFSKETCCIKYGNKIIANIKPENGIYVWKINSEIKVNSAIHQRLGHLSENNIKKLGKILKDQKVNPELREIPCLSCPKANFPRVNPRGKRTYIRSKGLLDLIHTDLWQLPKQFENLTGWKYFVVFLDDNSRFSCIYFLKHKSELLSKFILFQKYAEKKHGREIKATLADLGGEYTDIIFEKYLEENGIEISYAPTKKHQLNGVAERFFRTLMDKARAIQIHSKVSWNYWPFIISTANLLRNISPTDLLENYSPYFIWERKQPKYNKLAVWGCLSMVKNYRTKNKFDGQGIKCILLGYSNDFKSYKLLNTETSKIITRFSDEVRFDESIFPFTEHFGDCDEDYFEFSEIKKFMVNENIPQKIIKEEPIDEITEESSSNDERSHEGENLPSEIITDNEESNNSSSENDDSDIICTLSDSNESISEEMEEELGINKTNKPSLGREFMEIQPVSSLQQLEMLQRIINLLSNMQF